MYGGERGGGRQKTPALLRQATTSLLLIPNHNSLSPSLFSFLDVDTEQNIQTRNTKRFFFFSFAGVVFSLTRASASKVGGWSTYLVSFFWVWGGWFGSLFGFSSWGSEALSFPKLCAALSLFFQFLFLQFLLSLSLFSLSLLFFFSRVSSGCISKRERETLSSRFECRNRIVMGIDNAGFSSNRISRAETKFHNSLYDVTLRIVFIIYGVTSLDEMPLFAPPSLRGSFFTLQKRE